MSFTHLHVATTFSPGHGTATPTELAEAAARHGATALACTDRDGLYGAVEHVIACRAQGLGPILGVDLAVLEPDGEGGRGHVSGRVVVLARGGGSGYVALCRLVTDAHAHTASRSGSTVPVGVTRQELAARSVDPATGSPVLTVLVGPESDVGLAMHGPRYLRPRTLFKEWLAAMPTGTLAADVVSHHEPQGHTFTTAHAARMLKLAREHHVPAILSNAVRHLTEPPHPAEGSRAATAVAGPRFLSAGTSPSTGPSSTTAPSRGDALPPLRRGHAHVAGAQAYLKAVRGMEQTAREIGHAADLRVKDLTRLLQDTEQLAESCRLDPARDLGWGSWSLPEPRVLDLAQSPDAELAERCREPLERRVDGGKEAMMPELRARLAHELAVVESRGAAPFLLAAAEVTRTISDLGIRVQGRGVATASLAAHLLGITPVNPLNHGTACDGFLAASAAADGTEQLPVFPEIELDLESGRLREVHRALARRFGKGRVCLLGSVPAADAAPEAPVLPEAPALAEAPVLPGEVVETLVGASDPSGALPGGLSRQSSGLLFGDASLLHRIPTQPGGSGLPLSQYAPDDLVHWGALRVTLRESATQTVIARTLRKLMLRKLPGDETSASLTALDMEPAEEAFAATAAEQETPAFTDPAEAMAAHHVAWLRSRNPAAFIAACWDSPVGSAPRHLLRAEARRLGIPVLPLDVNRSSEECEVEDDQATADGVALGIGRRSGGSGLRPGLRDVPGLSAAERKRLVAGRPYHSVDELFTRAALSGATVRKLAEAGALDSLCGPESGQDARAAMVRNLQELGARPTGAPRAGVRGQLTLPLGDRLEVHDDGLVTGSLAEGAAEAEPHDDAAADPEAAGSGEGPEALGGPPAELAAVVGPPQLSRARTPVRSESPPPTSHTPDPVRRTGSG